MPRATITDVAKRAGVSVKTVSRVLNSEPRVKISTRARVEAAIRALDYRPNTSARMLASKRTYLFGLIYNDNSSFITSIQNGAIEACRAQHFDLMIHPCHYKGPTLLAEIRELAEVPRVDGLIMVPPVADRPAVRKLVRDLGIPNVVISRASAAKNELSVATNDRSIAADVVAHLVAHGHRRIAFLKGHPDHKAMDKRYLGFIDGMAQAGLKVSKSLVVDGDNSFATGNRIGARLLRRLRRPTAVFCANDHMAAGVMTAAHDAGLKVPGDVSIAGFDDLPLARQIWPALTTVRQPLVTMGRMAVDMLIDSLRDVPPAPAHRVIDAEFVIRRSTGPAPKKIKPVSPRTRT